MARFCLLCVAHQTRISIYLFIYLIVYFLQSLCIRFTVCEPTLKHLILFILCAVCLKSVSNQDENVHGWTDTRREKRELISNTAFGVIR